MNPTHDTYMYRCLALAELGAGLVAPNPMVGAILVYENRVIGEGFHQQYGGPHAEVNCINSVADHDKKWIEKSTLYVSLEPCSHFGKTPPCTDLIISHQIKKVVIGCRDPFEAVNGKGIEKLELAGLQVVQGVLEQECKRLNRRFFCFHIKHRPFIILKWAASVDGFIAAQAKEEQGAEADRTFISNAYSNKLVHKWRSEEASILVGTNTALLDNPSLTNRFWTGRNPTRLVIDKKLVLPGSLHLFDKDVATIVFNEEKEEEDINLSFKKIDPVENDLEQILQFLYRSGISSVMVEGGATLLQSFINQGLWDEARVIVNQSIELNDGLEAPVLRDAMRVKTWRFNDDEISTWTHSKQIL